MFFEGFRFRQQFGFRSSKIEGIKAWEQASVDKRMASLACSLDGAYKIQQDMLRESISASITTSQLATHRKALEQANDSIRFWKSLFWKAFALAKRAGFQVREHSADYLKIK